MKEQRVNRGFSTFLILWASQSLPVLGSSVMFFAMVLWLTQHVYASSSQQIELARAISVLSLSYSVPALIVAPFAGSIADRYNRRDVMLISNIFGVFISVAIPILMLINRLTFPMLVILMAGLSIKTAFHNSAFDATTVLLVRKEQLPRANGLMQTTWALSSIVSPPLATLLVSLPSLQRQGAWGIPEIVGKLPIGTPIALFFGVLSLVIAFLPLPFLPIPSPNQYRTNDSQSESIINELKVGFSFIWQRKSLLWLLLLFAVANFAYAPMEVLKPVVLRFNLEESYLTNGYTLESALALLGTLQGVGLLAGGVFVSIWGGLKNKRVYGVILPMALMGMALAIFGLSSTFYLSATMTALLGAALPIMNVHSQAIWQAQTSPELQGRVFSFRRVFAQATGPLGTGLVGWVAGIITPDKILVLLGVGLIIFALTQCFNRTLISVEDSPGYAPKHENISV